MSTNKQRSTPLLSGHTVEPFVGEEADKYLDQWKGYTEGLVRMQPRGMLMPSAFPAFHDRIMKFKFGPTDVVVLTYPKCGTTWMLEIVWTMRNNPDLNNPMAKAPTDSRVPFLEFDTLLTPGNNTLPGPNHPFMKAFQNLCPGANPADGIYLQMAENIPDPRTIKTHLPFSLLPQDMLDNAKVVHVIRNPKDMILSYLHHCSLLKVHGYVGSLEEFMDTFMNGDMLYGHYDLHLKEAFVRKNNKNLLIVHFEELKANPTKEIKRIDQFLGTGLSDEQISKVSHYTSFAEMKKRYHGAESSSNDGGAFNVQVVKKDGGLFRKGEAGNWKENMTPELSAKLDSWVKEKLGDTDISFKYSA